MDEITQKLYDERFSRDKDRLDKLESLAEEVSKCSIRLTQMVESDHDKIEEHDKRLHEIEERPRDWVDKALSGVIAAIVAFLMGVLLK